MPYDFPSEYRERADDELLELASHRATLVPEAAIALDAELLRRNLSDSDRVQHQRFVKEQWRREIARHQKPTSQLWGIPFPLKDPMRWRDGLLCLLAAGLIWFAYYALPSRYRIQPDWEPAAGYAMLSSVIILVGARSLFRRTFAFWIAWIAALIIHLTIAHAWTQRVSELSRGAGRALSILGIVLFLAIYPIVSLSLRKMRR